MSQQLSNKQVEELIKALGGDPNAPVVTPTITGGSSSDPNAASGSRLRRQTGIHSYPAGVSSIPYASFMKISKYTYDHAKAQVAANQNDALGSLSRATGVLSQNTIGGIASGIANLYGAGALSPSDIEGQLKLGTFGQTRARVASSELDKTTASSSCNLGLPNEFQYSYGANWNNVFKLGTLALLADKPLQGLGVGALGGALGAGVGAALSAIQAAAQTPKGQAAQAAGQGAQQGISFASNPFGVNSKINPTNIVGLAGLAPNENAIQFFKNVDFRTFTLNFEFACRNAKEAKEVELIIEWFKLGMHPTTKGTGTGSSVLLGFPDVFVLEPRFVDKVKKNGKMKSRRHPMMPKTKLCGLTNLTVNTTPMAQLQTMYDGNFPLITVQLTFTELTALTRADFLGTDGYSY